MKGHKRLSKIYKKAAELIFIKKRIFCCDAINAAMEQPAERETTAHNIFHRYLKHSEYDRAYFLSEYYLSKQEQKEHRTLALLMLSEMVKDL